MIFLSEPFNSGTLRIKPPDGAALGVRLRQEGGDCVAFGERRGPHDQGQVKEGIIFNHVPRGVSSSCVSITIFGLSPTFLFYQVPYSYCPTTEARNAFRRFSGSNPERWDYKSAGIPAPLTEEDEERQREKKRRQREKKREKDRDKKAAEKQLRDQVRFRLPYRQALSVSQSPGKALWRGVGVGGWHTTPPCHVTRNS